MTLGLVAKNSKNAVDNKIRGLVWFGRLSCISCLYNAFEILTKNVNSVTFQIKIGHCALFQKMKKNEGYFG